MPPRALRDCATPYFPLYGGFPLQVQPILCAKISCIYTAITWLSQDTPRSRVSSPPFSIWHSNPRWCDPQMTADTYLRPSRVDNPIYVCPSRGDSTGCFNPLFVSAPCGPRWRERGRAELACASNLCCPVIPWRVVAESAESSLCPWARVRLARLSRPLPTHQILPF